LTSWGRSFTIALKAILLGIVFAIVGVIIMALGVGLFYFGIKDSSLLGGTGPITFWAWIGIPVAIFGFAFSSIGFYAALIKFTVEEAVKEARGPALSLLKSQVETSVRTCPSCRTPLNWVEQYKRWYCPNCKEYIP